MGRKSKLTDEQWAQIGKRILDGEKPAALSREYKVSKATISERFSKRTETVKSVANQLFEAEKAVKNLPLTEQMVARTLAVRLISISDHLASSAEYGAMNSHRLNQLAHAKMQEVDDSKIEESAATLVLIGGITKLANEAAQTGMNLLKANESVVEAANAKQAREVETFIGKDPIEAAQAYQKMIKRK